MEPVMKLSLFFTFIQCITCLSVTMKSLSKVYLPYNYDPAPQFSLDKDAAEQLSFDAKTQLLYAVGHTNIHVIDMADVENPTVIYHKSYPNVDATDVEVCGDHVFVAFDNQTKREEGFVDVYRVYDRVSKTLRLVHRIIAGDIPDMVHPTSDCKKVIVAIEAEPYDDMTNQRLVDNPGGVGIITFTGNPEAQYSYKVLGFEAFNSRFDTLEQSGVRWIYKENGNTFANDIEPEYIAFNEEETVAYICLQENNAIAVVNLQTETIDDILGLGYKQWSNFTLDPSDRDGGINMKSWPVYGMYQPDSIKVYRHQGVDYIVMANEGDSKDYHYFSESARVKHLQLSDVFETNGTPVQWLQMDDHLGRLKVSKENGRNSVSGTYDALYAFGGRGFSIRKADTMELVYDSQDEIPHKTALLNNILFNSDFASADIVSADVDTRSDNKGPETESIAIGRFEHITLLLIGNERPGTIAVYTIDDRLPTVLPRFHMLLSDVPRSNTTWQTLYDNRDVSMLDPEDIRFVSADDSPNGKPLLLAGGSTSGTVTVFEIMVDLGEEQQVVGR